MQLTLILHMCSGSQIQVIASIIPVTKQCKKVYCMVNGEHSKPQQVESSIGLHHAYVDPKFAKLTYDDDASMCVNVYAIINIMVHNCDKKLLVLN
jgi:poly(A) polymerase Pap1